MKLCTQIDLVCFCSLTPQRRFFQQDPTRRSLMTSQKNSSHSFFFFFAPVCRRVPLSPSAGSIICRPHPSHCTSGDNLWLPGLSSHLGATLRNDRGSRGGLTVQAEAADHVLQSRAFRLPLLQRQRRRERGEKTCNSCLSVSCTVGSAVHTAAPSALHYSPLINDQRRRFLLAGCNAPGQQ